MGKKKKASADHVRARKVDTGPKVNPFEVKVNHQKHKVLGKKLTKFEKGKPGVSRSRANKKRKETLLKELRQQGKANKLVDRRIGENNPEMSVEEKMLQRFAREKQKYHEKAGLFSLNEDEEELTHYGQSLAEIEKFEAPPSDSDDEEDSGKISGDLVAAEHFGGGMLSKPSEEQQKKTWKQRMEELIAQSKKRKYERQSEKEKAADMTDKLDQEWKLLHGFVMKGKGGEESEPSGGKKVDEYDMAVRELRFEAKGKATDRLKTEEELAKEELEKLQKLEADRERRMKGLTETEAQSVSQHASADSLDDGLLINQEPSTFVRYKDGRMLTDDADEEAEDVEEQDGSDAGMDEESDQGDDGEDEEAEEEEDEDEESSVDAMEATSDLESGGESEPEDPEPVQGHQGKDFTAQLKDRKEMMESARKELPYTFPVPESQEELQQLLEGRSDEDVMLIITRIRTCNHPSLAEGNKAKLQSLFKMLLQYCGWLASQDPPQLPLVDKLTKHLYELSQMSPQESGTAAREILMSKHKHFQGIRQMRGGRGSFPQLDTLIYLKLVSILFPTSDLQHPVVTPAMLFMSEIITQCPVSSCRDVAAGLFTCSLFLEYVSFAKRLVPEALNFLRGVLYLSARKEKSKNIAVVPPFKPVGKHLDILLLSDNSKHRDESVEPLSINKIWSSDSTSYLSSDGFRLSAVQMSLRLLEGFCGLYEDLPSYRELMKPLHQCCQALPCSLYPPKLQSQVNEMLTILSCQDSKPRQPLVMTKKKPRPLKMFEPKFEEIYEGKKSRSKDRKFNEKKRLLHRHKKELKGAVRELRRDNSFLAREKLKTSMLRDKERERKTKAILASLAEQEGDYKALKREKNKAT